MNQIRNEFCVINTISISLDDCTLQTIENTAVVFWFVQLQNPFLVCALKHSYRYHLYVQFMGKLQHSRPVLVFCSNPLLLLLLLLLY